MNYEEPPHVNEIRDCEETVPINRMALIRLLMITERGHGLNGSDRLAIGAGFDALGVDGICRSVDDIPDKP